jgi:hypothetical protein
VKNRHRHPGRPEASITSLWRLQIWLDVLRSCLTACTCSIAPCVDPVLSDCATLFLVYGTSWLSWLHHLTWWINCLRKTSFSSSSSSSMTLQSNADLPLLNGLLPVSSVFYLSVQFVILQLLISVCTQFRHLFFGLPLSRLPWGLLLNTWLTFFYYPYMRKNVPYKYRLHVNMSTAHPSQLLCCTNKTHNFKSLSKVTAPTHFSESVSCWLRNPHSSAAHDPIQIPTAPDHLVPDWKLPLPRAPTIIWLSINHIQTLSYLKLTSCTCCTQSTSTAKPATGCTVLWITASYGNWFRTAPCRRNVFHINL